MVRNNSIVSASKLKGLLESDKDFLNEFVRSAVQEMLEAGRRSGAGKGRSTNSRLSYRSGIMTRADYLRGKTRWMNLLNLTHSTPHFSVASGKG